MRSRVVGAVYSPVSGEVETFVSAGLVWTWMVWRLPPPRIRPQPDGAASRSTSDAAEASVDGIRFMVRPRDGVI